jgi:hypothetical protein
MVTKKSKSDEKSVPLVPPQTTDEQARHWKMLDDQAANNDAERERIRERELDNG